VLRRFPAPFRPARAHEDAADQSDDSSGGHDEHTDPDGDRERVIARIHPDESDESGRNDGKAIVGSQATASA
jgi:hypothetical protein